jgi:hypothetical protein
VADTLPFPDDLIELQQRLHQARAEHTALCRASLSYTPEQKAEETRLWSLVQELSIEVSTHPYWATLPKDDTLVQARMQLKQHPKAQPDASGDALAA